MSRRQCCPSTIVRRPTVLRIYARSCPVNLAPADLKKEGSSLDLPIALGLLAASEQVGGERISEYAAVGELALNGGVRPVAGALPMALAAREQKLTGILVPGANAQEAGVVPVELLDDRWNSFRDDSIRLFAIAMLRRFLIRPEPRALLERHKDPNPCRAGNHHSGRRWPQSAL